jgi:hypothetical protein
MKRLIQLLLGELRSRVSYFRCSPIEKGVRYLVCPALTHDIEILTDGLLEMSVNTFGSL